MLVERSVAFRCRFDRTVHVNASVLWVSPGVRIWFGLCDGHRSKTTAPFGFEQHSSTSPSASSSSGSSK